MIVKEAEHTINYLKMRVAPLEDDRLSWEARGALAYMLSQGDDYNPTMDDIGAAGNSGRTKVRRIFHELEAAGYVVRDATRDRGRFETVRRIITDDPVVQS